MIKNVSEVNKEKRKERHLKLFFFNSGEKWLILKSIFLFIKSFNVFVQKYLSLKPRRLHIANDVTVTVAQRIIFKKAVFVVSIFFVIGSLNISTAYTYYSQDDSGTWEFEDVSFQPAIEQFIDDDEGYLIKSVPAVQKKGIYLNREETVIVHDVQENETLSEIAAIYGLDMKTIIWANNISNPNNLILGSKLKIPSIDGVLHTVKEGDTVAKLSSQYNISEKLILEKNKMQNDILTIGKTIVIPGGKPIVIIKKAPVYVAQSGAKRLQSSKAQDYIVPKSQAKIAGSGKMTFPTTGNITQGYYRSHLGIDIANTSRPSVWAARGGTVSKVVIEGWGGGYGKHIIIDHGKGLKTLYAHLGKVYVQVGQTVEEGQVIGQMGNTGRVYGKTGIHLHFEVHVNGVKVSPWNYL